MRDRRAQTGRLVGLHVDVTPNPRFYKLVAVDVHGNVSPAALVIPPVIVGVPGGDLPATLSLAPPTPTRCAPAPA